MRTITKVMLKILIGFIVAYFSLRLIHLFQSLAFICYLIALVACAYMGAILTLFLNEISIEKKRYASAVAVFLLINAVTLFLLFNVYSQALKILADFDLALAIIVPVFMVVVFLLNIPLLFSLIKDFFCTIFGKAKKDE